MVRIKQERAAEQENGDREQVKETQHTPLIKRHELRLFLQELFWP